VIELASVTGENTALTVAGAATIFGSVLALGSMAIRRGATRADFIQALGLLFLGVGAALGYWRTAYDTPWLLWAAIASVALLIALLFRVTKRQKPKEDPWIIRWAPEGGGLLAVRGKSNEDDEAQDQGGDEKGPHNS
jgi:hypothetical protein